MIKPVFNVVAALIFDEQDRILITQRHEDSHLGGYWEFPGGRIEEGEYPKRALVREIKEEIDIDIVVHNLLWSESVDYDSRSVNIRFYMAEMNPPGQQVSPLDVAGFRWIDVPALKDYTFPRADLRLVERLIAHPISLRGKIDPGN
jgi:8-oxo-dGTP diphosphatase